MLPRILALSYSFEAAAQNQEWLSLLCKRLLISSFILLILSSITYLYKIRTNALLSIYSEIDALFDDYFRLEKWCWHRLLVDVVKRRKTWLHVFTDVPLRYTRLRDPLHLRFQLSVFLSKFLHFSGHVIEQSGFYLFQVLRIGWGWGLHWGLIEDGFLSSVCKLQSWLCLLVAVHRRRDAYDQSHDSLQWGITGLAEGVFEYLCQLAVSKRNVSSLWIAQGWYALAQSRQTLVDRT